MIPTTSSSFEMNENTERTDSPSKNNDGLAAMAILVVSVALIVLVVVLLLS